MKATRRKFFAFAGSAPLAARVAADKAISEIAHINSTGLASGEPMGNVALTPGQYRLALLNPYTLRSVEALLYEQERNVYNIDLDLAMCRSFSLAAKVTYQRQRNVEKRLKEMRYGYSWDRLSDMVKKALGLFL